MRTLRTLGLVMVALVMMMSHPAASGLVGIFGVIERVAFEPSQTAPQRLRVWGAFALANGGVGKPTAWSAVKRGYLYFRLPTVDEAAASDIAMIPREWADLGSVAGTGQVVAFGRWGYIGRFEALLDEGQPKFLERLSSGGNYADLRVRPSTLAAASPAPYQTNAGVVRISADGSHADLVKQLRAALTKTGGPSFALQTGPPVAAMPDPSNPGVKKFKDVSFVVRPTGCVDLTTFRLTATAEGGGKSARRSVPLTTMALPQPGAFAVSGHKDAGIWVVSVSGSCGAQVAGATVPLINGAYRRDAVQLLSHHPTPADVDQALARPTGGGGSK